MDDPFAMIEWQEITKYNHFALNDTMSENFDLYQSWEWGEFKKIHSWNPVRIGGYDNFGNLICTVQIVEKKIGGVFHMLWVIGHPIIHRNCSNKLLNNILQSLISKIDSMYKFYYLRLYSNKSITSQESYLFNKYFKKAIIPINSSFTFLLDLNVPDDIWMARLRKKHRYYVRNAEKSNIVWKFGISNNLILDFVSLHDEMAKEKKESFGYSYEAYALLTELLNTRTTILIGYYDSEPIAGCYVLKDGDICYYMSAATNKKGKALNASYSMIYYLKKKSADMNVSKLDLGGIAPGVSKSIGVDHFKMGFAGEIVKQLGEWEHGNGFARILGNFLVWLRIK